EDHHVVAMAYTDAAGKARTRLALKLRPDQSAWLQQQLPDSAGPTAPVLADFVDAKASGLELLKGLNSQAAKGLEIRLDKEVARYQAFRARMKALMEQVRAAGVGDGILPAATEATMAASHRQLLNLESQLDDYFRRHKPGDKAQALPAFDFNAVADRVLGPVPKPSTGASRSTFRAAGGLTYSRAEVKAGRVRELPSQVSAASYARRTYVDEFDGGRVTFVPDHPENALAIRGYAQVEVDGVGPHATARAIAEPERPGLDHTRASPDARLELYLDRHLYLRSVKDTELEGAWLAIRSETDQLVRNQRKLELLNKAA